MQKKKKILVLLEVNDRKYHAECLSKKEAIKKATEWIEKAKETFPNGNFEPLYFHVLKKE